MPLGGYVRSSAGEAWTCLLGQCGDFLVFPLSAPPPPEVHPPPDLLQQPPCFWERWGPAVQEQVSLWARTCSLSSPTSPLFSESPGTTRFPVGVLWCNLSHLMVAPGAALQFTCLDLPSLYLSFQSFVAAVSCACPWEKMCFQFSIHDTVIYSEKEIFGAHSRVLAQSS